MPGETSQAGGSAASFEGLNFVRVGDHFKLHSRTTTASKRSLITVYHGAIQPQGGPSDYHTERNDSTSDDSSPILYDQRLAYHNISSLFFFFFCFILFHLYIFPLHLDESMEL